MQAWSGSNHALAERLSLPADLPALARVEGREVEAVGVIGVEPLVQYLVAAPGGRLQATTDAFDVNRREWFDTLHVAVADDSWAHHRGGGNTWNRSCVPCHATGVSKGYDAATDTWATHVDEHGVTCVACHPSIPHGSSSDAPSLTAEQVQAVCEGCHTRRTALGPPFRPGDLTLDHYLPQLVDGVAHHADGQIRDEVFEGVAFWGSAMHGAGVGCIACHDPHSARLRAPGDAVCATCHAGVDHDLHEPSVGCVACHMPVTTYMQRDPRHDHGLFVPDPVLGAELGLPHACDRCHDDDVRTAYSARWPDDVRADDRDRIRAWVGASRGDLGQAEPVARHILAGSPGRRAAAATLALPLATHPEVDAALRASARDDDAVVRLAAVQTLAATGPTAEVVAALTDPVRAVRVAAALALGARADGSPGGDDRDRYLAAHLDHPSVRVGAAELARARGQLDAALEHVDAALALDRRHRGAARLRAVLLSALGRSDEARRWLETVVVEAPDDEDAWALLGLARAEGGDLPGAEAALSRVAATHPAAARDLGLLLAGSARYPEAARWLFVAVDLAPTDPDVRFALAAVLRDWGRVPEARAAAYAVLQVAPDHAPARALLRELSRASP